MGPVEGAETVVIKGLESVRGFGASDGGAAGVAAGVAPRAASTACTLVPGSSTRACPACGAAVVDASAASGERDIEVA